MARPFISRQLADKALARLEEIMDMEDQKGLSVAQKSAADIIRFFQVQENYQLKEPRDYERSLRRANSQASRLENLSPEALAKMQREMVADYPGKPS
jgi:hypothetical protein